MTTVGYGDIVPVFRTCDADPAANCDEGPEDNARIYAILIMLVGATVFGYVVGSTASGSHLRDRAFMRVRSKMSTLRHYLEEQSVPPKLREVVQNYMAHFIERYAFHSRPMLIQFAT